MKITKFGHCCLLIEENGVRILTDPGTYSTQQSEVKNIDFVLITHEHADHFHIDSLKALLKNNPQVKVITNKSVGEFLKKDKIAFSVVENGQNSDANGVLIEGFGESHALMHNSIPPIFSKKRAEARADSSPCHGYFPAGKFRDPSSLAFTHSGLAKLRFSPSSARALFGQLCRVRILQRFKFIIISLEIEKLFYGIAQFFML